VRRRNVAWDDGRYCGTFWTLRVGGSYSATGVTANVSLRGGLTSGLVVNGHSPTHRSIKRGACWRVADMCSAAGHHRTIEAGVYPRREQPEAAVTVGSRAHCDIGRADELQRRTGG